MNGVIRSTRKRVENIVTGKRKPGALLLPLVLGEWLYGVGVGTRNLLYDMGAFKSAKAPCKVVSVGNLCVGGSGKTPFVELVVRKLAPHNPGILSRGYGGAPGSKIHVVSDGQSFALPPPVSADEPYMLARKLPGVPVVCSPDRIEGAKALAGRFGTGVIVLDDGFQHRAIERDLNILLVNSGAKPDMDRLLPMGSLREPYSQIRRADIIVITGGKPHAEEPENGLIGDIRKRAKQATPIIIMEGKIVGFNNVRGEPCPEPISPVYCFCGIARPKRFIESLEKAGYIIAGHRFFGDHHVFTRSELERIYSDARSAGAKSVVTTEKDAVRMTWAEDNPEYPVACPVWKSTITKGEEELDKAIERLIRP